MDVHGLSLGPIGGQYSRKNDLVRMLADDIRSGRLQPGQRLPTELDLVRLTGVSRTVVREAVAELRAEGLLVTRQGVGAFVADAPGEGLFRIAPDEITSVDSILHVLEMRLGIEVEGAGIAARRASATAIRAVEDACEAFKIAASAGESTVDADFAFHRSVAEATGNGYFPRVLDSLGRLVIPRHSVAARIMPDRESDSYRARIAAEHQAIFEAIQRRDIEASRAAMRLHLSGSITRYRTFAT